MVTLKKAEYVGRFIVSEPVGGETIVTDTDTKLIWQGSYVKGKTWIDAISYSKSLRYGGYKDWRLPTKEELQNLINKSRKVPASDFPKMPSKWFWSSSLYTGSTGSAWGVYFGDGSVCDDCKDGAYNVRCVRGGK